MKGTADTYKTFMGIVRTHKEGFFFLLDPPEGRETINITARKTEFTGKAWGGFGQMQGAKILLTGKKLNGKFIRALNDAAREFKLGVKFEELEEKEEGPKLDGRVEKKAKADIVGDDKSEREQKKQDVDSKDEATCEALRVRWEKEIQPKLKPLLEAIGPEKAGAVTTMADKFLRASKKPKYDAATADRMFRQILKLKNAAKV